MDSTFEQFRGELADAGFQEVEAESHPTAFGSWHVVIDARPRLRVVWDGKDHWLIVKREESDDWSDVWIGRDTVDQTPDRLLDVLRSFV